MGSELAQREEAAKVLPLRPEIQRVIDATGFDRTAAGVAVAQGPWKDAIEKGGVAAVAGAITTAARLGFDIADIVSDPPLIYVANIQSRWQHFLSGHGLLALVSNREDFDGIDYDPGSDVRVEGDVVYVTVRAWRKLRRFPAIGEGHKRLKDSQGNVDIAKRKAKTMAIRHALSELYRGILPVASTDQVAWEDTVVEPDVDERPALPARADGLASNEQLRHLFALVRDLGWDDEQRHNAAGVDSFKEITGEQASKLIDEWTLLVQTRNAGTVEEVPFDGAGAELVADGQTGADAHREQAETTPPESDEPPSASALDVGVEVVKEAFPGSEEIRDPIGYTSEGDAIYPEQPPAILDQDPATSDPDGQRRAHAIAQLEERMDAKDLGPRSRRVVLAGALKQAGVADSTVRGATHNYELVQLLSTEQVEQLARDLGAKKGA